MITGHTSEGDYLAAAEGELTIYTAAACAAQLRKAIDTHPRIVLDLSAVREFDTAGVQLLLLARRKCNAQGKVLQFTIPSPAVQDVVELLRLHDLLGMPQRAQQHIVGAESVQ